VGGGNRSIVNTVGFTTNRCVHASERNTEAAAAAGVVANNIYKCISVYVHVVYKYI